MLVDLPFRFDAVCHSHSSDSSQTQELGLQLTHSAMGPIGIQGPDVLPPVAEPADATLSVENALKSHAASYQRGQQGLPSVGG